MSFGRRYVLFTQQRLQHTSSSTAFQYSRSVSSKHDELNAAATELDTSVPTQLISTYDETHMTRLRVNCMCSSSDNNHMTSSTSSTCPSHDFSSNEGFVAKRWGRLMWILMHTFAVWADRLAHDANTDIQKVHAIEYRQHLCAWINGLTMVLMCSTCRQRFELFVAAHPIENDFNDLRQSCVDITCRIHNVVNSKLNRPCVDESQFSSLGTFYAHAISTRDDMSLEWRTIFWSVLFILSLNFPSHFNPSLPRYAALLRSYRDWIECAIYLIPSKTNSVNTFAALVRDATSQPFRRYSHNHSDHDCPTFKQALLQTTLTRDRLFHWVFDLSSIANNGVIFGDCHATQEHFETEYRYKPTGNESDVPSNSATQH